MVENLKYSFFCGFFFFFFKFNLENEDFGLKIMMEIGNN